MFKNKIQSPLLFSSKRGTAKEIYGTLVGSTNTAKKSLPRSAETTNLKNLNSFPHGGYLDPYFDNPAQKRNEAEIICDTLYTTSPIFAGLVNYYRDLYYWRYVTIPRKIKNIEAKTAFKAEKDYASIYRQMLEIAEGTSFETVMPNLLLSLFKTGAAAIYVTKDKKTNTVTTLLLPNRFTRAGAITQHGTQQLIFDFKFFTSVGLPKTQVQEFVDLFPEEFRSKYKAYNEGKASQWQMLDSRYSTVVSLNEARFPTLLNAFYDIIDLKSYKINELEKNTNKLERVLVQEIDLEKSKLDLPEVEALHDSVSRDMSGSTGTRVTTTIGKIHVEQLQEDSTQENKALAAALNSIYSSVGLNSSLFNGTDDVSLEVSLKRDLKLVWTYVEKFMNFYNLSINNLYNFGDYQMSLKMLPLSPYDSDTMTIYRENATYGVGTLDFVIASGVKQVDLESTLELEDYLDLNSKLRPLQSAHTLSSSDNQALNEDKTTSTEETPTENNKEKTGDKDE